MLEWCQIENNRGRAAGLVERPQTCIIITCRTNPKKEIKNGIELLTTPGKQAEAFANVFKSKWDKIVEENQKKHDHKGTRLVDCGNYNFFMYNFIHEIMTDLKSKPCFGSDRIPLKVLREGVRFQAQSILKLMILIYE
jgi:hypothetical protein